VDPAMENTIVQVRAPSGVVPVRVSVSPLPLAVIVRGGSWPHSQVPTNAPGDKRSSLTLPPHPASTRAAGIRDFIRTSVTPSSGQKTVSREMSRCNEWRPVRLGCMTEPVAGDSGSGMATQWVNRSLLLSFLPAPAGGMLYTMPHPGMQAASKRGTRAVFPAEELRSEWFGSECNVHGILLRLSVSRL
jgi:hypothetical protein